MYKSTSIQDLWCQFKKRSYGKDIGNISVIQLKESKLVFHSAIAAILIELKENVSLLPEEKAVNVLKGFMKEITIFYDKATVEYDRMHKRNK